MEPGDHLFRHEAGRMVAALTRIFGMHNLALAEDVVQDAFCRALEVWKFRGVPENPSAWLMATAKNRALDVLRRERTARTYAPELGRLLESEWTLAPVVEEIFSPQSIRDDELRMMFSCCHPRLPEVTQVALILHILCGFSVREVSSAFLTGETAMEKRISRAKKVLAGSKRMFDLHENDDFALRLSAVQRALYLLFNEGYHGASATSSVRVDLCHDAMRLVSLLREHPQASTPATYALCALMCFNAARLPARLDSAGDLIPLFEQDRSQWDRPLAEEGQRLLELAATGRAVSEYHVEAAIAAVHANARSAGETDWQAIVSLYDLLLEIRPSPVIALNRAIAIAQQRGPESGLEAIRAIDRQDSLTDYPFYSAALGELELRCGRPDLASEHFRTAVTLARNPNERRFLERRLRSSEDTLTPASRVID
jgi:RNA polymerase sigma factor (sigma-70 family)